MRAVFGPHDRETSATGSVFAHLWNESNRLGDHTRREKEENAENWNHRGQYATGTESRGRRKVGARYPEKPQGRGV